MRRELETDGVKAPSDFELEAMDRMRRRPKLSFNGYTLYRTRVSRPINDQREAWHEWLSINAGGRFMVPQWDRWWNAFIAEQDDHDLEGTRQDALT